ncbi:MAG: tyrosine-type recombinase/integrase [Chloroflexota bacterium]|nr:tyrosine-type recombinase/integrase [Chloroflexota bacterium]
MPHDFDPLPTDALRRAADLHARTVTELTLHDDNDWMVIGMWLHGRPASTQSAYRRDVNRFLDHAQKPLKMLTLADVQAFDLYLQQLELADTSRKRALSAVKSLYTFAQKTGYLQYNVGAAVILPKSKNTIAERILSEAQVQALIDGETDERNRLLLLLLYATGARVSELCGLCWRDCQPQKKGGQVTLYGKGSKTRHVLLKAETFLQLLSAKGAAGPDDRVFPLSRQMVWRIVQAAALRVGIEDVSPHWLRHAHASHALDNGAPVHLVQQTLGHASLDTTTKYSHARPTDSSARYLTM